jgi:hypothetical protein
MMRQHLAHAEDHVPLERLAARQRTIVTELRRAGHDTHEAKVLLAEFERSLRMQIAIRERLRVQLAEQPAEERVHEVVGGAEGDQRDPLC